MTRRPCPGLWKTPVVRWDGELMVCCADIQGGIKVGNLKENTFKQLWEGKQMKQYRVWHILGQFDKVPLCSRCGGINFYKMEDNEIIEYLKEIGREDLIEEFKRRMKDNAKNT